MQLSKSCALTLDVPLALQGQFLEGFQIFLGPGHLLEEQVELHQSGRTSASTQAQCTTVRKAGFRGCFRIFSPLI